VGDNEEAIEHTKGQRWHSEKVHRGNDLAVITEKGRPSPCRLRVPGRFVHPVQYGSLRDAEAEHLQLAVNPWRSPGGVLGNHTEDQLTQFLARRLPTETASFPGDPFPVQLESGAMPTDNRFGLNDKKSPLPSRPESAQGDPEQLVRQGQAASSLLPDNDRKLLSQSHVLKQQIAARTEELRTKNDENAQDVKH
jgi:hypothetical protein